MDEEKIDKLAQILSKQIDKEVFSRRYAPAKEVLKLIGAGVFLAASFTLPTLPMVLKPFLKNKTEYDIWKRFNIPYLKRTIQRLEKQRLIEIENIKGAQSIKITSQGRQKIVKMALDDLSVVKPARWNGKWTLVSFDLPEVFSNERKALVEYLRAWGFYPLHKSVYLHAWRCFEQVDFLRDYLGVREYVRLFAVSDIENDRLFREHFGI